jgi:hypothetical protein
MVIIQKVIYIFVETFNNRTMNHLTFQERLSDMQIPAFARKLADKAIQKLQCGGGTISANSNEFWQIVKHSRVEPIKCSAYTFIRIYDDYRRTAVDIQTLN